MEQARKQQEVPQKSVEYIQEIKMEKQESIKKPDDADKDEGHFAGSGRGLKRQKTSTGTETLKKTSFTKDSSKGKSPATLSKSSKSGKCKIDEKPNDEAIPKNDWYKKFSSDTSPNPEWNEGKSVDDGPKQSWLNDMAKATKPPLTFHELMHTPINFSAFVMNHLKIDNLTKQILVRLAYNLLKGTCKSYVELDYTMKECYCDLSKQLECNNPKVIIVPVILPNLYLCKCRLKSLVKVVYDRYALLGISYYQIEHQNFYGYTTKMVSKHDVYLTKRILNVISVKVNKWYGYGHLEEIVVKRADEQLYTFKIDPQGVIYEDKLKQKIFMRDDELHKFSDGTLISIRDTLSQMLHELHSGYNKTTTRRSLEEFVGGREYEEDLRLL
uniref:Uncharacterized protein n=1 Tax=Tanacetum cinerariifolium TaxID=118510 RepID=A0A699HW19_TANCI|nr:hypothetical protein [Tanacetum cinerariifolium]